jgi:hypothetical protein
MKQKLFIHIGMPKTGTTGLQFFMHRNRQALLKQGVYYPITMREPLPTATQHRYVNEYLRRSERQGPAAVKEFPNPIRVLPHEITRKGAPVNVISEELFSFDPTETAAFLAGLKDKLDCRVVIFVRRQDTWSESMYAQSVRGGYRETFERFMNARHNQERLDLVSFCGVWAKHFGAENVIVKRYIDRVTNTQQELMNLIGVDSSALDNESQRNKSLTAEAISFMKDMRKLYDGGYPKFNQIFGEHLSDITKRGSVVLLSRQQRAELLSRYEAGNAEVVRRYMKEDPSLNPLFDVNPEKFPQDSDVMLPVSDDRRIELLTELLSRASVAFDRAAVAGMSAEAGIDHLMDVMEAHLRGSSVAV